MDGKVLRFLGTTFLMLRGRSMLEASLSGKNDTTPEENQQGSARIRVLLADDSQVVRKAMARILRDDPDIQLVAEAVSFRQTIELAKQLQPQVIVMDLHMGDEHVQPSHVKMSLAASRVLAVCLWTDTETQAVADSFGAVALLKKANLVDELVPMIKRHASLQAS